MNKATPNHLQLVFTLMITFFLAVPVAAQTTAFTYQGKLTDSGNLASGSYDLQIKLYDTQAVGTGTQQGTTVAVANIPVTNGIFTAQLDFGVCASCFNGAARFLEIAVKPNGGGTFTTLAPRQPLTSTPYAIRSLVSTTAEGLSVSCVNCITSSQIQSVSGSAVTGTIPIASVPAGSTNYIQNQTAAPQAADFNISGNGTAGGTLSAIVLNATTQYNLGGNRVLSNAGTRNLFAGVGAGQANVSGLDNAFFGFNAGLMNNTGARNTYNGVGAGQANVNGHDNAFFGFNAGLNNIGGGGVIPTGNFNAFFGVNAGRADTTGGFNSFFGANAGRDSTTGNTNSFFGYNAGSGNVGDDNSLFGTSAGTINKGNRNSVFGASAGRQVFFGVPDPPATGDDNAFFGNSAGASNTANGNSFFGSGAGNLNTTGGGNSFFGYAAGAANTAGAINAFFGYNAGVSNSLGSNNAFFGSYAGFLNTTGQQNAFFGSNAGAANTSAFNNAFFGSYAGYSNTTGQQNAFFGYQAGFSNTIGDYNNFFGANAGFGNTAGILNNFFGREAGFSNTTGFYNNFLGGGAGRSNTTGNLNTIIGDNANVGFNNLNYATAIGAEAIVTASNMVQIGRIGVDQVAIGAFAMPSTSTHVCINSLGVFTACSSSLRYKTAVRPFRGGLSLIQRLRPITFTWKESGLQDIGLGAEEVAQVDEQFTFRNSKGQIEGVKYTQLSVLFINAFKEQQSQIQQQQTQIEKQQAQIQQQQEQIQLQQQQLNQQQQETAAIKKLLCQSQPQAEFCKAKTLK